MVYTLASPLFTDYALKFRTITLPQGARLEYKADGVLDFPVGTVISKTFLLRAGSAESGRLGQGCSADRRSD